MVCNPGLHRGRNTERSMYATEVEKSHIEIHGGAQMVQRLAEPKTQARKASKMRPHAQVGPFDMGSADSFQLRVSADWYWDRRNNLCGVVPLRAFGISLPVEFEQLREVNVRSEVLFDCGPVDVESVCRDLESASHALAEVTDKSNAIGCVSLSDKVRQNHFSFGINCHPYVSVAPLFRHVAVKVSLFGVNEGPKFVSLHKSRTDISHFVLEEIAG